MQEKEVTILCPKCSQWFLDTAKKEQQQCNNKNKKAVQQVDGKKNDSPTNQSKEKQKKDDGDDSRFPCNSIASGIDFSDPTRIGLEKLTPGEAALVACVRHFHNIVKVQDNHLEGGRSDFTKSVVRGHSILFRHDAPVVASLALIFQKLKNSSNEQEKDKFILDLKKIFKKLLTVELLGPKGQRETLAYKARMQTVLQVRPHVVYQWLAVLQHCHPLYTKGPWLHYVGDFTPFSDMVKKCGSALMENAVHVNDRAALLTEKLLGDDVAQIRTGILDKSDVENLASEDVEEEVLASMKLSYSYVANSHNAIEDCLNEISSNSSKEGSNIDDHKSKLREKMVAQYMEALAEVFNISLPEKAKSQIWKSTREENPLNEFEDMQTLLVGAYPWVFLLGKTYPNNSLLNPGQMEHLLLQYTNAAATCRELLFYLHDCQTRHRILRNLAFRIKKDPSSFDGYAKLMRDDVFRELIIQAAQDPKSDAAKQVLRTVLPVLSFGARNNLVAGSLGDPTSLSRAMANAKRYGHIAGLVTVTPDDINCPRSLRLASKTLDNTSFPAIVDDSFFEELQKNATYVGDGNVRIPLNYTARWKAATENPVAVAVEFRAMIENVLQILIGCPLDFQPGTRSSQKRTWFFKSKANNCPHHKGIFGHVPAFFGCVETQARGSLHFHILLWGGITPKLLEKAASFPEICSVIQKTLDSMYSAEIPKTEHVKDILIQKMKKTQRGRSLLPAFTKMYPSMQHVPSPRTKELWDTYFHRARFRSGGIHEHTFSCKQKPAGAHRCRNCRPAGNSNDTCPKMLEVIDELDQLVDELSPANKADREALTQIIPTVSSKPIPQPPNPKLRNYYKEPIPKLQSNLVVWELRRPLLGSLAALKPEHQDAFDAYKEQIKKQERATTSNMAEEASSSSTTSQETKQQQHPLVAAQLLAEAKEACIHNIVQCLEEDAMVAASPIASLHQPQQEQHNNHKNSRKDDDDTIPSIRAWLENMESHVVIGVYLDLNQQLGYRNGLVTETNPILACATGGSTNAVLLGNVQQSSAALFYVAPYVTKNKVKLDACLVALEMAQQHVEKFPSIATDSGTAKRYVQHMFTKVLNDLSRSIEVSDTQVALSLLNMGSEVTSDSYKYFGADYCVNYFVSHQQEETTQTSTTGEHIVSDDESDADDNESRSSSMDDEEEPYYAEEQ